MKDNPAKALLSVEAAQTLALQAASRVSAERVTIIDAHRRVIQEDVVSDRDLPPFDNSAMDGFAVRAIDTQANGEGAVELDVIGESAAGHPSSIELRPGQAIRISTGADLPAGADAVVMVEVTELHGSGVRVRSSLWSGENVRRRGEDLRRGTVVLRRGQLLGAAEIAILAALQRASVRVSRRPIVAVLTTGDELRDIDQPMGPGSIVDSNSYAMAMLIREAGATPQLFPLVKDDPALLRAAILQAKRADLIVSTGGVSVGEHDHVKQVLQDLGAPLTFWRVDMKPGKPVALALLDGVPFFGLPGNPASAMVSFCLFVRPAILAALGHAQPLDLPIVTAKLDSPIRNRGERRTYLRGVLSSRQGELTMHVFPNQGSHLLSSMIGANALAIIEGASEQAAGSSVSVLILTPLG